MADVRERDTYVVSDSGGGRTGGWIFAIVLVLLAALGIWYFAANDVDGSAPSASVDATVEAPATTGAVEPQGSGAVAPEEPAAAAPAAPDPAPAAPAPAE